MKEELIKAMREEVRRQIANGYLLPGSSEHIIEGFTNAALTLISRELQAKDTTIKEQAGQIEKLTGLLKEYYLCFRTQQDVSRFKAPDESKYLNELKEQHNINS